ncbi:MAG: hypothetical protein MZW92_65165 [Comamonadaceae bacterium]|nr:hypothetical protein [Comamonadaceae bacterium]
MALGVGVTAVVQSVLGGIGLALAGVPLRRAADGADVHALHRADRRRCLVLLPAVGLGASGAATRRLGRLPAGLVGDRRHDWTTSLRPVLIRMGADLPLLLIFAGVIGGLLAFGLVGIFVGPVVLAVGLHAAGRAGSTRAVPRAGRRRAAARAKRGRRATACR